MVTSVIQLRRMNCDGPWGVALLGGQPLRMVLVNCQRTPGGTVTSLTLKQDTAVKLPPNLELEDIKRAS